MGLVLQTRQVVPIATQTLGSPLPPIPYPPTLKTPTGTQEGREKTSGLPTTLCPKFWCVPRQKH